MTASKHTAAKPRVLFLLRHAKSDWESSAQSDFERPLAKRGKKEAPAMGKWMARQEFLPDHIISSPALRAKETLFAVAKELGFAEKAIHFDEAVYMADVPTLLRILAQCPREAKTVMLVGHNPGFDDLLQYLVTDPPLTQNGKLMTTAALARIALPKDWSQLARHCGELLGIDRPRDLE